MLAPQENNAIPTSRLGKILTAHVIMNLKKSKYSISLVRNRRQTKPIHHLVSNMPFKESIYLIHSFNIITYKNIGTVGYSICQYPVQWCTVRFSADQRVGIVLTSGVQWFSVKWCPVCYSSYEQ